MSQRFDVLVLGGGAAGLFCAAEAGKRGRRVAILEHNREIGRKILISGGGRCNFTNLHVRPENFLSDNPHFTKSALARYRPSDFLRLIEKHRIPYHEKKLGQLFCDRSSRDIVEMLRRECEAAGVAIYTNCRVQHVRRDTRYTVETSLGDFVAPAVVVATGGLSIPKIGATGLGYDIARRFGLNVIPCRPALVPLILDPEFRTRYCDLAGVALEVVAASNGARFREKMLITHRGLSGPAILQVSSYWRPGREIQLDLMPEVNFAGKLLERKAAGDRSTLKTILACYLPVRLAERWVETHGINGPISMLRDRDLSAAAEALHCWRLHPCATEGYEKAEVTAGGVDTAELSSKTFEARKAPGLYFIGEVVDVTGWLGGYNFHWAWASAWCAGHAV